MMKGIVSITDQFKHNGLTLHLEKYLFWYVLWKSVVNTTTANPYGGFVFF